MRKPNRGDWPKTFCCCCPEIPILFLSIPLYLGSGIMGHKATWPNWMEKKSKDAERTEVEENRKKRSWVYRLMVSWPWDSYFLCRIKTQAWGTGSQEENRRNLHKAAFSCIKQIFISVWFSCDITWPQTKFFSGGTNVFDLFACFNSNDGDSLLQFQLKSQCFSSPPEPPKHRKQ